MVYFIIIGIFSFFHLSFSSLDSEKFEELRGIYRSSLAFYQDEIDYLDHQYEALQSLSPELPDFAENLAKIADEMGVCGREKTKESLMNHIDYTKRLVQDTLQVSEIRLEQKFTDELAANILKNVNERLLRLFLTDKDQETSSPEHSHRKTAIRQSTSRRLDKDDPHSIDKTRDYALEKKRNDAPLIALHKGVSLEVDYDAYESLTLKFLLQEKPLDLITRLFNRYLAHKDSPTRKYFMVLKSYILDLQGTPPDPLLCFRGFYEDDAATSQLMIANFQGISGLDQEKINRCREELRAFGSSACSQKSEQKKAEMKQYLHHMQQDNEIIAIYTKERDIILKNLEITKPLEDLTTKAARLLKDFEAHKIKRGHYSFQQKKAAREEKMRAAEETAMKLRKEKAERERSRRVAQQERRRQREEKEAKAKAEADALRSTVAIQSDVPVIMGGSQDLKETENSVSLEDQVSSEAALAELEQASSSDQDDSEEVVQQDPYADLDPEIRVEVLRALKEIQSHNQQTRKYRQGGAAAAQDAEAPTLAEAHKILLPKRQFDKVENFWGAKSLSYKDLSYIFVNILGAAVENQGGSVRVFRFENSRRPHIIHEPHSRPALGPKTLGSAREFLKENLGLSLESFDIKRVS